MNRYICGEIVNQLSLVPMCLDDMVTDENPVRAISKIVEEMDIPSLGFKYTETKQTGRKAYDPIDMFKIYAYSYYNGIRSSRKIEQECNRNLELMWLTGKLAPDFKTLANFRKDNKEAIQKAFYRFGAICGELGLIGKELVAIDGSKFKANNSRNNWFNKKKFNKQIEYYRSSAKKYIELLDSADDLENQTNFKISKEDLNKKLSYINSKLKHLESLEKTVNDCGEISITDKDSRIMKLSNGGCGICHNVQVAVDEKEHIVIAIDTTSKAGDKEELSHMSKLAKNTLKADKLTVLADKGYYAANEFAECHKNNINVLVSKITNEKSAPNKNYAKINFIYDKESNCYICPQGKILSYKERKATSKTPGTRYSNPKECKTCTVKEKCTTNKYRCIFDRPFQRYADEVDRNTKINIELYKKRQQIVEHTFGSVKRNLGYTHFLTVGKEKVLTESCLHFLAYNMKRAIKILGVKGIFA